jgi:hypothetical protein
VIREMWCVKHSPADFTGWVQPRTAWRDPVGSVRGL